MTETGNVADFDYSDFSNKPILPKNQFPAASLVVFEEQATSQNDSPLSPPPGAGPPPPLPGDELPPLPGEKVPPLPGEDQRDEKESGPREAQTNSQMPPSEEVELPLFGKVDARKIGMPLFTVAIGLVDGFNPCAMWVLLFLLSLLVNLHSRTKMFAIAGVFVLISGIAYFTFMAAWLNVFLLLGYLRSVEITLGILSIVIGGVHIKDFFALKQGPSLSIPESAKPGIYARVRKIISAESMWVALIGATVLAILVNIIELLCTAGLPAIYTKILTMQKYPAWKNYAYLGLYNFAYMFDDSVMVILAVVTLGKRKLQEKEGRWLKLISGLFIFLLGVLMLVAPHWLT